ncbi:MULTISPECIES: TAXI family TRAP transporter solute-binding subunit [unclassified Frankia]|uniref:TAXI family TRAP transporter solute-binding subunit n=1 Tax=unclassified Frankia TaxID=2632575 RepID=UPI0004619E37|nr:MULTISPECIES: TAXI family TRAP transporter solute-binding subunit [unclassified Frankia]KDA44825.1 TRAP-type uncharacterized transport system, periplasmic component [Frankia sp. BMG5.23]
MSNTRSRLGRRPIAITALVILAAIVGVFIGRAFGGDGRSPMLVSTPPSTPPSTPSAQTAAPEQARRDAATEAKANLHATTCTTVRIIAGQPRTPYSQYASTLAKLISDPALNGGNGWRAFPDSDTSGTSQNLKNLGVPENRRCTLALAQLNVVVDAQNGRGDFTGGAVEGLSLVGQIYYDVLQLIVPADSSIHSADDLCGKTVESGLLDSGTHQIATVLFRQITRVKGAGCVVRPVTGNRITEALQKLHSTGADHADAVLWAAGAPTMAVQEYNDSYQKIKFVPLDDWQSAIQRDWYSQYLDVGANVFTRAAIEPGDYNLIPSQPTATLAVPNGIVASRYADPALVEFAAWMMDEHSAEFKATLWATHQAQAQARRLGFATPGSFIATNICRYVPLHPAAERYYTHALGYPTGCPAPTP